MRRGSWLIRPVTIDIRVGQPIETAGMSVRDRDALIERVRFELQRLRDAQRTGQPPIAPLET